MSKEIVYGELVQPFDSSALRFSIINGAPIPPIVDVVPYYQVNDKILFLFQKPEGVVKLTPTSAMKSEYKKTFEVQQAQFGGFELKPNEMFFGCRAPPSALVDICPVEAFVVYRVSNGRPKSFDELGAPYAVVPFEKAFFIDSVEPNKQYYYVFRSRTKGKANYESFVEQFYLVELRQEAGLILPNVETLKFKQPAKHKKTIKFNKRLKIKPAFLQAAPNPSKLSAADAKLLVKMDGDLGFEDKSVFVPIDDATGKSKEFPKWKFRIISSSTQRKIDINVFYRKKVEVFTPGSKTEKLEKANLRRDIEVNKYEKILAYNVE